jgi:hypothetical protein
MDKQDQINELIKRIRYNQGEALHYAEQCDESADGMAMWVELKSWYEGRTSAFRIALALIDPDNKEVF